MNREYRELLQYMPEIRTVNVDAFVHEYRGRWVVASYRDGKYYTSMRPEIRKLTGCGGETGPLSYVAGNAHTYKRRSDAVRKARELYGEGLVLD